MSSLYNIDVFNSEISNFNYVLKAYKQTFANEIKVLESNIYDCLNGFELSEETDDKGNYNVEFLIIENCNFSNIQENVIDYYRGDMTNLP